MTQKSKENIIHEIKRTLRTGIEFGGMVYMHYIIPEKSQIIKVGDWFEGNILVVGMVVVIMYPVIYQIFTQWKNIKNKNTQEP